MRGGESRALVVRGEPGVGKTALLEYVAEHASSKLPTKHRIFPRNPDGQSLGEPLVVAIDLSEIAFT